MRMYIRHSGSGPFLEGNYEIPRGGIVLNEGKESMFPLSRPLPVGGDGSSISYPKRNLNGFGIDGSTSFITLPEVLVPKFPNEGANIR